MKGLFLIFAVLWFGVTLSAATRAPELKQHHRENHWFSTHRPKADFGKHFFSMAEEKNTKKLSRAALISGILSAVTLGIGSVLFFATSSYTFSLFFLLGAALSICAFVISITVLRRKDSTKKDNLRSILGLIGGVLGLLAMLPALLLSALEVD